MSCGRALTATLVVAALSAAGCSTSTSGTGTTPARTAPTTTAPAKPNLSRVRTFNLSTVDPCVLLTSVQRTELGANLPASPSGKVSRPTCNFTSRTATSYAVFLTLNANATDTVGAVSEKVSKVVDIDGFRVAIISIKGQGCSAFVNTGDTEYLSVQANGTGRVPDDLLCQQVQPATQMVLANLTALQP